MKTHHQKMKVLIAILSAYFLLACQNNELSKKGNDLVDPPPEKGTTDGGGGDATGTSPEVVKLHIKNLKDSLRILSHRAKYWRNSDESNPYSKASGTGRPRFEEVDLLSHPDFLKTVETVTINATEADCHDHLGDGKDGSADLESKSICLSINRLSKISSRSVGIEILALAVHEIAHLLGEKEFEAKWVQKWVVIHPEVSETSDNRMTNLLEKYNSLQITFANTMYAMTFAKFPSVCTHLSDIHYSLDDELMSWPEEIPESLRKKILETSNDHGIEASNAVHICADRENLTNLERIDWINKISGWQLAYLKTAKILVDYDSPTKRLEGYSYLPILAAEYSLGLDIYLEYLKTNGQWKRELNDELLECNLKDMETGKVLPLRKLVDGKGLDFTFSVTMQNGSPQIMKLRFRNAGKLYYAVSLQSEDFNKFRVRLITESSSAKNIGYFYTVHGPQAQVAAFGSRSMAMEFYVSPYFLDRAENEKRQVYQVNCSY